jgi:FAD/FMN-containing dehydrogenase
MLLIRFAGHPGAVLEQTRITSELLKRENGTKTGPLVPTDLILWKTLAALPSRFSQDLVWRVGLRPADIGSFLAKTEQVPAATESIWQAAIGDGRIRVVDRLQREDNDSQDSQSTWLKRIQELRTVAQSFGAALVVEQAPAEIKEQVDSWGTFGSSAGLMQRVKQQLDPDGILSPGRFDFDNC